MAKIYTPMLSVILFLLFSCKREEFKLLENPPLTEITSKVTDALTTLIPTSIISAADTVVPANAVSVKKYGAKGDGVTDDTKAIQAAINAESVITFSKGTFIINKTLNLRSGVKIYGATGARIKAGNNMSGTLVTNGRYFSIDRDDNCLINNMIFAQSAKSYKLSVWSNACIYVYNSRQTEIKYNTFQFSLPYAVRGLQAIWVSGSMANNTLIKGNTLTNVGIEYAESGAKGTIVDGNTITHAPSDAIMGHGNISEYCTGNVIINNIIENSGFMGIEDWGNIDGTIIRNNTITGTGKDPAQKAEGMGISVVGANAKVIGNRITDAQLYYIEAAANRNQFIDSNIINDNEGLAAGIMVNVRDSLSARSFVNGSIVSNNVINGTRTAILVFGDNTHTSTIKNNVIKNPRANGVMVDGASPTYKLDVINNSIAFDVPNNQARKGFESYTRLVPGTGSQNLTFDSNTVTYATSAAGGPGIEFGFMIGTCNTTLNNNKITGNNIKAGNLFVIAICGNSTPALNMTLTNNNVTGAVTNFNDFTITHQSGNSF